MAALKGSKPAALAKAKKCTTCHAVAKLKLGPSYRDIAKKYANDKDASSKLAAGIIKVLFGNGSRLPCPRTGVQRCRCQEVGIVDSVSEVSR